MKHGVKTGREQSVNIKPEWLDALRIAEDANQDALTPAEIRAQTGQSRGAVGHFLDRELAAGRIERVVKRMTFADGRRVTTNAYRPAKGKP